MDCNNIKLKLNSTGDDVKELQTILTALGYYTRQIDGEYGDYTKKGVITFQTKYKLTIDGWVGSETCKKLKEVAATNNVATNVEKYKTTDTTPEAYKKITYELIIKPDVVVLPVTQIDGDTRSSTGGSINTETNFDCTKIDLKKGSTGDNVKKLQTILKARGYYTRQIDGEYGKYTFAAVKSLQKAYDITQDGKFGPITCNKLQQTSTTSNNATATSNKKNKNYTIKDFKGIPQITTNTEDLSEEITIQTPYSYEKAGHIRKLQKTQFTMKKGTDIIKNQTGYIKDIKINNEDDTLIMELQIVNYVTFIEQTVEFGEKTAKRSELLKELIKLAGLKANIDTTGLNDDEYTIKVSKATISNSGGGGGLVEMNGNDCTETNPLSARSFDIDACKGGTKIGNSSANYAQDTKHMTAKEAILDVFNRFHYGPSLTSSQVYNNNRRCPQAMWTKTGKFWGNCADISRLVKAMGEVHGLKVGIRHAPSHYYNLIEVDGKVYRFDCCFSSTGYMSSKYGGELCNNLNKNGGPWQ